MAVRTGGLIVLLTFVATPLFANNHPGPQECLVVISLPPLMMLLTAIGGGYAVLRRLKPQEKPLLKQFKFTGKVIGAILLVVVAGVTEGIAMWVALIFSSLALVRAASMIRWGLDAREISRPEHLSDAKPRRLISAGVVLISITVFLAYTFLAFLMTEPLTDEYRIKAMREYVALRLALRTPPSPQRAELEKNAAFLLPSRKDMMNPGVRIDEAGDHFVVYMLPHVSRTAFPPYNRFVDLPTYRADDTGVMRMTLVHSRNELCPPDAPIIGTVGPDDIRGVLEGKTK